MKRLFLIFCLLLSGKTMAAPAEYRGKESVQVARGDTVSGDLLVGSRYLDVYGVVTGDLFGAGERALIEGSIGDDCMVAGREIIIRGTVKGMVFGFAETVIIDGEVGDDVIAFAGNVRVTERGRIRGNLHVATGELRVEGGVIEGGLKGGCGKAYLNGSFGGKVDFEAGHIAFGANYTAAGGTKLKLSGGLKGKTIENLPANAEIHYQRRKRFYQSVFFFWSFLSTFVIGILYVSFFRNFSRDQLRFAKEHAASSVGIGFLMLVATPIVILILGLLVLTLPVALILLAFYLIILYSSSILSGLFLGNYLLTSARKNGTSKTLIWGLLVGLILLFLLAEVPFIGWLFELAATSFGMGGLAAYLWHLYRERSGTQQPTAA